MILLVSRRRLPKIDPADAELARHPAILLVLGFVLTGFVGSWLNTCWHSSERDNDREFALRQATMTRKHELIDLLIRSTATYMAASRELIAVEQWHFDPERRKEDIRERIAGWEEAKRTWLAESVVIENKLGMLFPENESARIFFECIASDTRHLLPELRAIAEARMDPASNPEAVKEAPTAMREAVSLVVTIEKELARLARLLREDVRGAGNPLQAVASASGRGPSGDLESSAKVSSEAQPETRAPACLPVLPAFKEAPTPVSP